MDGEVSTAKMQQYIEPVQRSALVSVCGWTFEIQELTVFVTLRHRRKLEATYLLKVVFDDFPKRPPSYIFVDSQSRQMTVAAWPPNVRHGAQPPGICTPGTREFHEHWHKNDAQYRWSEEKYPFLDTLLRIQKILEAGIGG